MLSPATWIVAIMAIIPWLIFAGIILRIFPKMSDKYALVIAGIIWWPTYIRYIMARQWIMVPENSAVGIGNYLLTFKEKEVDRRQQLRVAFPGLRALAWPVEYEYRPDEMYDLRRSVPISVPVRIYAGEKIPLEITVTGALRAIPTKKGMLAVMANEEGAVHGAYTAAIKAAVIDASNDAINEVGKVLRGDPTAREDIRKLIDGEGFSLKEGISGVDLIISEPKLLLIILNSKDYFHDEEKVGDLEKRFGYTLENMEITGIKLPDEFERAIAAQAVAKANADALKEYPEKVDPNLALVAVLAAQGAGATVDYRKLDITGLENATGNVLVDLGGGIHTGPKGDKSRRDKGKGPGGGKGDNKGGKGDK